MTGWGGCWGKGSKPQHRIVFWRTTSLPGPRMHCTVQVCDCTLLALWLKDCSTVYRICCCSSFSLLPLALDFFQMVMGHQPQRHHEGKFLRVLLPFWFGCCRWSDGAALCLLLICFCVGFNCLFFKAWLAKLYSLRSSESGPWSSYHNAGELGHGEGFGYGCSLPVDDTDGVDGILGGREGCGGKLGQHDGSLDKLRSCKHGRRRWGNRNVILGHRLGSNLWKEVWTWSESRRGNKLWYFDGLRRCCLDLQSDCVFCHNLDSLCPRPSDLTRRLEVDWCVLHISAEHSLLTVDGGHHSNGRSLAHNRGRHGRSCCFQDER